MAQGKKQIFNFPLSSVDRDCLEEVAATWQVGLAEAVRRSLKELYQKNMEKSSVEINKPCEDGRIRNLETIIGMHQDLVAIHQQAKTIINLIQEEKDSISNTIQELVKSINTAAIILPALLNSLTNHDQVETEIQKNITKKPR